jgi:hypothetical protein
MELENKSLFGEIIFICLCLILKWHLNLSRGKPTKYYSSNRIASLMGNGLLVFIDKKVQMNDFFNAK